MANANHLARLGLTNQVVNYQELITTKIRYEEVSVCTSYTCAGPNLSGAIKTRVVYKDGWYVCPDCSYPVKIRRINNV
jgi:hypothetical protein